MSAKSNVYIQKRPHQLNHSCNTRKPIVIECHARVEFKVINYLLSAYMAVLFAIEILMF